MAAPPVMVGNLAPDFEFPATGNGSHGSQIVRLADFRGRWLMLVFYPRDFSLVCPTELTALSMRIEEFRKRGCAVLGVSTDPVATHEQWIAAPRAQGGLGGLAFPLAADVEGVACRAYGVYLEWQNLALRGLFIIDPNGVLQYSVVHNTSVGRRTDELLRVLDALQSGGLCAENWTAGAAPLDPAAALVPGSVFAHYRFESKLGSGSFAAVFKAHDLKLDRTVAVKVIRSFQVASPAAVMNEARTAAALQHPHLCTIFSVDDSEGVPLIVMEYVSGGSLAERLKSGPVSAIEARTLGTQVARGIEAAHRAGIVHGDLKPENILIGADGAAKVTDFGLGRRENRDTAAAATLTWDRNSVGGLSGTPGYIAPELLEGQPSSTASDVYALGIVLYEMLTGRHAVEGNNVLEVLNRIRSLDGEQLAAGVPAGFRNVLREALRRDPQARPSMGHIAAMLAEAAVG
jgi:alkyl hydroperoxide reductase subunit AhpC/tRNA A-37 threonylcarbamoyl transferase component Bud32